MKKAELLNRIVESGIVAVVRTSSSDTAKKALDAVLAGGVVAVEVTFTVPNAPDVIREASRNLPDGVILGAGTVTDAKKCEAAVEAGAQFIVAPNTDAETIRIALDRDIVTIPGALTPTEVVTAIHAGADAVKIFPASAVGPSYIKALRGPLPDVLYCPTGGVELDNIAEYITAGAAFCGIGGSLVDTKLIAAGRYAEISDRARRFVEAVHRARESSGSER